VTARSIPIGSQSYPLVLPNYRDPRLHVAAVIITIHVLGQVALHFRVSVPQILAAILTCAVIEISLTFRQKRAFVWPASAMLTGSGVALILRVVGTPPDQPWNTEFWWVFAIVAGLSLLSKYVIRYRGGPWFNPSNLGLVVTFVVLGSSRVEPLDFWWGPLTPAMLLAYTVIIVGGVLITRRLRLLPMALTFWVTLAIGVGILAASGHSMTANWAFAPVSGFDFWRVIVTSPEVLIFMFFMITDPQTIPGGRVGRVAFAFLVAVASTLLLAPQTDEFGTKVGLLSGLVLMCAARPLLDRFLPVAHAPTDTLRGFGARLFRGGDGSAAPAHSGLRVALAGCLVLVLAGAIVGAGTPARDVAAAGIGNVLAVDPGSVNVGTLPPISVGQDVIDFDHDLAGNGMAPVVVTLAQNLELENQALLEHDASLLTGADHGDRLVEMQAAVADAAASGTITLRHYHFDDITASLLVPFGRQTGLSLGLASTGTVEEETYDRNGALQSRDVQPFDLTFAVRRATGDRWLNVAVLPPDRQPQQPG
jgi:Na+-translocating ferredoxin:NAD+ oxidoreductase RnfD subunit